MREPRGASRGGGVLLRSELVEQNEGLARENEDLRAQLAECQGVGRRGVQAVTT